MTELDWIIVAVVALMAVAGAAQGFVIGAATLAGFSIGLFAGGRLAAELIESGSSSPYAPLFSLVGAVLGGALFAGVLQAGGASLRARLRAPASAVADALGGALLSAALALGLVWLGGAVALNTPMVRDLRDDIQRSAVLRRLNATLPPSGPILNALARFDPFPRIEGPPADVPPPRAAIARDPDVRAAAAGVVKVTGTACGLSVEGSGWIAAPGIVVTNAHVVAGQDDTGVELRGEGPRIEADVVAFDRRNDVAVLRAPGLGGRALKLAAQARAGASGAILGFPQNGPYSVRAARLGSTQTVRTQDAYGAGPVTRRLVTVRGVVRPGNSGGPVVDARGRVVTTVFAATRTGPRGGYGVPNEIVARAVDTATGPVETGPCAA